MSRAPTEADPVRLFRYSRGKSSNNRPLYGWSWRCPCGEKRETNMDKRNATSYALDHVAFDHTLPRRKRFVEVHRSHLR